MGLFDKIFGKKENKNSVETDGKTFIKPSEGTYIFNTAHLPDASYENLKENDIHIITANNKLLKDFFAGLLKFDYPISNHPQNLDEVWDLCRGPLYTFEFMGMNKEQISILMASCFGQYMCEQYNMKWLRKTVEGESVIVIWTNEPQTMEMYPFISVARAIEQRKENVFVELEAKLKNALQLLKE